jgi:phytoene/squalene synthetase
MLHPARYIASLYLPPHMRPPMCLQYAVMALAATISPEHSSLALPLYQRARDYIQADEMKVCLKDCVKTATDCSIRVMVMAS